MGRVGTSGEPFGDPQRRDVVVWQEESAAGGARHVAIIMDGNGRWAKARHLPRIMGHHAGVQAVERTVRAAKDLRIPVISLYAFSTENWKRPKAEVLGLMGLFRYYVAMKVKALCEEGARLRFAGSREGLPEDVIRTLEDAEDATASCRTIDVVVCLNYGGRREIIDAVNALLASGHSGPVTEELLRSQFYIPDLPDPDLVIRTSGEHRMSNFWLWEGAYSELYFTDTLWPDFGREELEKALKSFSGRERRYGGVGGSEKNG